MHIFCMESINNIIPNGYMNTYNKMRFNLYDVTYGSYNGVARSQQYIPTDINMTPNMNSMILIRFINCDE